MGTQVYAHFVVYVEPIGVMILLLCNNGNRSHEAERLDKIRENQFAMKFSPVNGPARDFCQAFLDLSIC